ncbi:uncharacterized protein LY79DRAFT_660866 [Colletotrichum navitas]|uniref:Uncharacterized protein n=1 Tax=Colletotrichum navitas TaxID=681940 RepID=A0AAD8V3F5_9PEZI|nr:uncharacterized protein LY79DRAFT_660866 [Colletotrichum navitas]KAK1584845.1 hypothetical protein LY79DRAFT_660866 [Colletotrichum navitas]
MHRPFPVTLEGMGRIPTPTSSLSPVQRPPLVWALKVNLTSSTGLHPLGLEGPDTDRISCPSLPAPCSRFFFFIKLDAVMLYWCRTSDAKRLPLSQPPSPVTGAKKSLNRHRSLSPSTVCSHLCSPSNQGEVVTGLSGRSGAQESRNETIISSFSSSSFIPLDGWINKPPAVPASADVVASS